MKAKQPERQHPDKGWDERGLYRCLGFGCGWTGWPFQGSVCKVCGTPVAPETLTQARWRREYLDTGRYAQAGAEYFREGAEQ